MPAEHSPLTICVNRIFITRGCQCAKILAKHHLKRWITLNTSVWAMPNTSHYQPVLTGRMIMHIKSILSAAVIALVAGLGTASAAGEFAVLDGLPAEALSARDMAAVRGTATPDAVLAALAMQALAPPAGPGNSVPNFNGAVAGPIWVGRAACAGTSIPCT